MPTHNPGLTIPAGYLHLIRKLCDERGIRSEALMQGFATGPMQAPNGRLPMAQVATLLQDIIGQDPAMAYEIGLNANLTTHGFVGMGLITLPDVRSALEFGKRYVNLRTPFVTFDYTIAQGVVTIQVDNTVPLGPLRQFVFEHFLTGIWRIAEGLAATVHMPFAGAEILFDFAEPAYFSDYRERLPHCRFDQPLNALRFPSALLDRPLTTSDETAAQLVLAECEKELAEVGATQVSMTARVRAVLAREPAAPSLTSTASRLHLSTRSLKRRLACEGTSYTQLVEARRQQLARQWLSESKLSVREISTRLGYRDPANFTRAFRKWTGQTPSDFRARD